jgi:hypothetical protein
MQNEILHTIKVEIEARESLLLALREPGTGSRIPLKNLKLRNGNSLRQDGTARFWWRNVLFLGATSMVQLGPAC